jgi:hypothetical protein
LDGGSKTVMQKMAYLRRRSADNTFLSSWQADVNYPTPVRRAI